MNTPATPPERPLVSILLLTYCQQGSIERAIRGALAQTYSPLEIIVSDDASSDGTWDAIQRAVKGYQGPHSLILNRNPRNLGIGAHINHLVDLTRGELLFVAAGDDVSVPRRCDAVVQAWLDHDRQPDVIASALLDMDETGATHGKMVPSDLRQYRSLDDWLRTPPVVIGAAQAWTRRLFNRFGPLPAGVVAEDLIMVFRAIGSGGGITLPEPLVFYGRGGISRRVRNLHARDVIERILKNNRHALIEYEQLLCDARTMGQLDAVQSEINAKLLRERFIRDIFAANGWGRCGALAVRAHGLPLALRVRMWVYAALPALLGPFFWLKRLLAHGR